MVSASSASNAWPDDGLEYRQTCPLCGAQAHELLYEDLHDHYFACAPGIWSLYQCAACQSGYLNPRPTQETIGQAYRRYYTHESAELAPGRLRRLWRALRNDYLLDRFGLQSSQVMWPGRWLLRLFPIWRQGVDTGLARNLEPLPEGGGRLLDIGCGNGNFLAFARDAGWEVRGLDFDGAAVAAARKKGLDVLEGTIDLLSTEQDRYDRITLSHVLEHVYDPWDILSACYRLLKPGGVLWLETPNMNASGRHCFGPFWRGLEPPRHLHLFSRRYLKSKIHDVGFEDIRDCFSSFAAQAMWQESRVIMEKAGAKRRLAHSTLGLLMAEIRALFSPDSREFITLVCMKKHEKK